MLRFSSKKRRHKENDRERERRRERGAEGERSGIAKSEEKKDGKVKKEPID
jgi:hypothetical protein